MTKKAKSLYLPQLDGLRFCAFLLVFLHHGPYGESLPFIGFMNRNGWVGVEIFFVISSFLFFHLLSGEEAETGTINIANFYIRRALRILPLMWVFTALMLVFFYTPGAGQIIRGVGIILGIDNLLAWFGGYNSVPFSAHLWTLSFEIQVYLVIPGAFFAYRMMGTRKFLCLLAALAAYCTTLRIVFVWAGVNHPTVWATPFLRPEAILLGIALSVIRPAWNPLFSLAAAIGSFASVAALPPINEGVGAIIVYPFSALGACLLLDAALRLNASRSPLKWRPIRYLGEISFGLYVFHLVAKHCTSIALAHYPGLPGGRFLFYVVWFGVCIAFASLSYAVFERPILRLKNRFSVVNSRPNYNHR